MYLFLEPFKGHACLDFPRQPLYHSGKDWNFVNLFFTWNPNLCSWDNVFTSRSTFFSFIHFHIFFFSPLLFSSILPFLFSFIHTITKHQAQNESNLSIYASQILETSKFSQESNSLFWFVGFIIIIIFCLIFVFTHKSLFISYYKCNIIVVPTFHTRGGRV